jgi:dual-specificity kinase
MVFDLLGISIYDYLKSNAFHPFPLHQIQHFAIQILQAVDFLHTLRLIHTDLKPGILLMNSLIENLMLVKGDFTTIGRKKKKHLLCTDLRLIDFGSAVFEKNRHGSVVSTRHYRAPEIILNMGWSFPCDMVILVILTMSGPLDVF